MASKSKVCFFFEKRDFQLADRNRLKTFIESVFKKEGIRLDSLNFIFVSDKRLLEINRQYLNHNYFTDIISFELSGAGQPVVGDIYISIDRVRENAADLGTSFKEELHRVIFHGVLHLCGYGDKSSRDIKEMRSREDYYLSKYFK